MSNNPFIGWFADLRLAAAFLTRVVPPGPTRPLAEAAGVFPLVGAAVGLGGGLVYGLALWLGLGAPLAATAAVAALVAATGALHEDGLADVADGFGGGADRDAKLAIMRDSRIGGFGVIAVALGLIARIAALTSIGGAVEALAALTAAGCASRAVLPAIMHWLPAARADGLGAAAGRPSQDAVMVSGGLAVLVVLFMLDIDAALVALAAAAGAAWGVAALARRQIGGHTGDVLGAAQQASEIAALAAAVALS